MKNSLYGLKSVLVMLLFTMITPLFAQGEMPDIEPIDNTEILQAIQKHIEYPEDALYDEEEGTVYMAFKTDENQKISKIYVIRSKSDDAFEEAAHNAVKSFAECNEHQRLLASNHAYEVAINFNLEY